MANPRVAQGTQEVGKVVVTPHKAWPAQHSLVGVLHEVLCLVTRAGQSVRGPVEAIDVIGK